MTNRKILIATIAGAMLATPVAAVAQDYRRDNDRYDRGDRDRDRGDRYDRRGNYDRDRGYHRERRYRHARWRRGERLGGYHRYYAPVNYRAYRLRAPPRGYHWVRDDRGDLILAAIATGLIVSVIANSN